LVPIESPYSTSYYFFIVITCICLPADEIQRFTGRKSPFFAVFTLSQSRFEPWQRVRGLKVGIKTAESVKTAWSHGH